MIDSRKSTLGILHVNVLHNSLEAIVAARNSEVAAVGVPLWFLVGCVTGDARLLAFPLFIRIQSFCCMPQTALCSSTSLRVL